MTAVSLHVRTYRTNKQYVTFPADKNDLIIVKNSLSLQFIYGSKSVARSTKLHLKLPFNI